MPSPRTHKRKRTVRTRTVKPLQLKSPIVLAGVLVFAVAIAVALWSLTEDAFPYADALPTHRERRVAGAVTDFVPGPVTVAIDDPVSPASFVVMVESPVTAYQLLILASSRTNIPLQWGVGPNDSTILRQIGPLVATETNAIALTIAGQSASLDDVLAQSQSVLSFSLKTL